MYFHVSLKYISHDNTGLLIPRLQLWQQTWICFQCFLETAAKTNQAGTVSWTGKHCIQDVLIAFVGTQWTQNREFINLGQPPVPLSLFSHLTRAASIPCSATEKTRQAYLTLTWAESAFFHCYQAGVAPRSCRWAPLHLTHPHPRQLPHTATRRARAAPHCSSYSPNGTPPSASSLHVD